MTGRNSRSHFDVAIVGGGPAGSALALSLHSHAPELSTVIIEASAFDTTRIGETLAPNARPLLEKLGVWSRFLNDGHLESVGSSSSWGGDDLNHSDHLVSMLGNGWHLDRHRFDAMLTDEAAKAGVRVLKQTQLSGIKRDETGLTLQLNSEHGEHFISTSFVADATGRRCKVARRLGAKRKAYDKLVGVFTYFHESELAETFSLRTLIEPVEEGWWYSARLPEGGAVVALMTDSDIAHRLELRKDQSFRRLWAQTQYTCQRMTPSRVSMPVSLHAANIGRLDSMAGKDWIAVGDAASSVDPLSGQGMVKSLASGLWASFAIGDQLNGNELAVKRYEMIATQEFEAHLPIRCLFYANERRWSRTAFWRRRNAWLDSRI